MSRPGNVTSATPTLVMPRHLCSAFQSSSTCAVLRNEYPNGDSQRRSLVTTPRRTWRLAQRLTPSEWTSLQTFYSQVSGGNSFYFYDPWETSPRFSHDSTGQATTGRYVVRFASDMTLTARLARVEASWQLVEVS